MPSPESKPSSLDAALAELATFTGTKRRKFLTRAAGAIAPLTASSAMAQASSSGDDKIEFSPDYAATEMQERSPEPVDPPSRRIGFAVVGIGRLTVNQIMPAFGKTEHCMPREGTLGTLGSGEQWNNKPT